jgi:Lanthionine synthetase C-like protein
VASIAGLPRDDQLDALLLAGGELTWAAGPLRKGANLCHGTAGNGFALLKLFTRTGDESWLQRARRFAMHSAGQVAAARRHHGCGRYSLWTGDLGTALFLQQCLDGTSEMPTIDMW